MKKILLSLFVGLIGIINFGYCNYNGNGGQVGTWTNPIPPGDSIQFGSSLGDTFCIQVPSNSVCDNFTISIGDNSITGNPYGNILCLTNTDSSYKPVVVNNTSNGSCSFLFFRISHELLYPDMTSLECQTEYNLIPISSVDQNYCVNNGFCPSGGGDCPVCPGSGDWSALYINDIQHLGKPIINITFPDYLDWDYTSTGDVFNLDIVGYPVDTEYIDGIIRTQNYKPTSEDFTQLVGMLAPYSKYLLFLLFIFIIWAWIKKPFKSKKL